MGGKTDDADDFLEDYYDVIVLSTGLGSSILAAALAKSGKSVLHLDSHDHYGQESASLSFTQLLDWTEETRRTHSSSGGHLQQGDSSNLNSNANPDFNLDPNSTNLPGSTDATGTTTAGGSPSLDGARAGTAIARALCRNQLKKERDATAATIAAAATAKDDAAEDNAAAEVGGGDIEAGKDGGGEVGGAGKVDGEGIVDTDAGTAGDILQAAPAATVAKETPTPPTTTNSSTEASTSKKNDSKKKEEEEEERAKQEAAEEDERTIAAAAATRLLSLDLHLLPLAYHGCRTRAGPPSNACVRERADWKAAGDAAAASGRFGRPLPPSHPAWAGRREPSKDYERLCSAAAPAAPAAAAAAAGSSGGGVASPAAAAATGAAAAGGQGEGDGGKAKAGMGVGNGVGGGAGAGDGGAEGCWDESVQHPSFWGYRTKQRPCVADLVRLSRSFNLDLTCQVLLATGPAVDTLVSSGVGNYLEFKDMQGLYLGSDVAPPGGGGARGWAVKKPAASGNTSSSSGSSSGSGSRSSAPSTPVLALSRVPCSKADVFGTKLLTPLEKRRLMRFLLFASDWGLQRAGEDVLARNEAGLGRGRSLRRPQNREAASSDFDADAHSGKSFVGFLESCGLPERVRAMIVHALALLPGSGGVGDECGEGRDGEATTEEGLEAVCRHLSALGRFGETAFIAPLYGVGELSQSFCRMAAVHGAVYVLRRQLKGAVVDRVTKKCVGVIDESGRAFACGSVVVGGEYLGASPCVPLVATKNANANTNITNTTTNNTSETTNNNLDTPRGTPSSAKQVVAGAGAAVVAGATVGAAGEPAATAATEAAAAAIPTPVDGDTKTVSRSSPSPSLPKRLRGHRRLLRRVVVTSGPVGPEGAGRGLFVLPPRLRCVGNPAAVHGVSLDEDTAACPPGLEGACVLHLTTTTTCDTSASEYASENSTADANADTGAGSTNTNANTTDADATNANADTSTAGRNRLTTNISSLVSNGGKFVKGGGGLFRGRREGAEEGGDASSSEYASENATAYANADTGTGSINTNANANANADTNTNNTNTTSRKKLTTNISSLVSNGGKFVKGGGGLFRGRREGAAEGEDTSASECASENATAYANADTAASSTNTNTTNADATNANTTNANTTNANTTNANTTNANTTNANADTNTNNTNTVRNKLTTNISSLVSNGGKFVKGGEGLFGGRREGAGEGGCSEGPKGAIIDEDGSDGVLARAAKELVAAAGVHEIWSVGFSWDVDEQPHPEDLPPNMVVCGRPSQELYLHDVVVKAESAFNRLCPGEPFWPPPSKTGPGYSGDDDDDDDQAEMLRAAASTITAAVATTDSVTASVTSADSDTAAGSVTDSLSATDSVTATVTAAVTENNSVTAAVTSTDSVTNSVTASVTDAVTATSHVTDSDAATAVQRAAAAGEVV